jgi:hypothetical protein
MRSRIHEASRGDTSSFASVSAYPPLHTSKDTYKGTYNGTYKGTYKGPYKGPFKNTFV